MLHASYAIPRVNNAKPCYFEGCIIVVLVVCLEPELYLRAKLLS